MSTLRKQLFDWSSDSRTSSDFFRTVSSDLFSEQVFVFTPKGDVIDLPAGATPVDFAFRVHTDVGLRTVGARVNGVMMSLDSELQNGDVVELITRSNAQPSLDWLKFVKSAHARSRIKSFLRKRSKAESAQRGREAVEKELRRQGLDAKEYLSAERINEIAQKMRQVVTPDDVFSRVGEGLTSVLSVVQRLKKLVEPKTLEKPSLTVHPEGNVEPTVIAGVLDNVMFRRGKCCQPVPGDDAAGYVTRGRGIMIHRRVCPNFLRFVETEPDRITPVAWSAADVDAFPVTLRIVSVDRDGLLNDITTILAEAKAHVVGAKVKTLRTNTAEIDFIIKVRDVSHLRHVMSKIGHLSDVLSILRVFGR
jgi:GTP pyrophosphokinase